MSRALTIRTYADIDAAVEPDARFMVRAAVDGAAVAFFGATADQARRKAEAWLAAEKTRTAGRNTSVLRQPVEARS